MLNLLCETINTIHSYDCPSNIRCDCVRHTPTNKVLKPELQPTYILSATCVSPRLAAWRPIMITNDILNIDCYANEFTN